MAILMRGDVIQGQPAIVLIGVLLSFVFVILLFSAVFVLWPTAVPIFGRLHL